MVDDNADDNEIADTVRENYNFSNISTIAMKYQSFVRNKRSSVMFSCFEFKIGQQIANKQFVPCGNALLATTIPFTLVASSTSSFFVTTLLSGAEMVVGVIVVTTVDEFGTFGVL